MYSAPRRAFSIEREHLFFCIKLYLEYRLGVFVAPGDVKCFEHALDESMKLALYLRQNVNCLNRTEFDIYEKFKSRY